MGSHVLDIGEKEEAFTIVHTATNQLRQLFKYIDKKLDEEEPGFREFQKMWYVAKSLSNKVSPHPSREWLNKFGEYISSDSEEDCTSEDSKNEKEGIGESDISSMDLDDKPPIWILHTNNSEQWTSCDASCVSGTKEDGEEFSSFTNNTNDFHDDWAAESWKHMDPVVVEAVRTMLKGVYLSPAALRFLCEQVTTICVAANRANGKLCRVHDRSDNSCTLSPPWECTLEMCFAMSDSVLISEATLERAKCRMKRILNDKNNRKAVRERRQLRLLLISVLYPRYRNELTKLSAMVDIIFEHFGSIQRLFTATQEELATIPRIGPKNLELLQSWKKTLNAKLEGLPASSPPS